jgi:hypothetical protein
MVREADQTLGTTIAMVSSVLHDAIIGSQQLHVVPPGSATCTPQPAYPPPRSAAGALWPLLFYLPILPSSLKVLIPGKPVPHGLQLPKTLVQAHLALALAEWARFYWAEARYHLQLPIASWQQWAQTDIPPLPTGFDLVLCAVSTWTGLWLAKISKSGNTKIIRTSFQAIGIIRLVAAVLAFSAMRRATALMQLSEFQPGAGTDQDPMTRIAAPRAVEALAELEWAARLYRASSRLLDAFAIVRALFVVVPGLGWFSSLIVALTWASWFGFVMVIYTSGLPGGLFWFYGAIFGINILQDWVGRAVKDR